MLSEKPSISKGYTLYESTSATFLKSQNYRSGEERSGCQGLGGGIDGEYKGLV